MSKKLLMVMAGSDAETPGKFSAPLFQAMVAAAMTLAMWGRELIDENHDTIGAARVVEEAMHDNTVTLTC